jgi:hypothetical protein
VNSTEFEKPLSEVFERRGSDAAHRWFYNVGGMICSDDPWNTEKGVCWESKKRGWIGVLEKNTRSILGVDILEKVPVRDV